MSPSLRALLTGVIDYAGLFPPASLPLDQAVRNYARYRTEPESWMLARFVCPANRLPELAPQLGEFKPGGDPLALSVLGVDAKDKKSCQEGLIYTFVALQSLQHKYGERVGLEMPIAVPKFVFTCAPVGSKRAVRSMSANWV